MTIIKNKETGCIYYLVTDGKLPVVKMRGVPLNEYNDLELMDIVEIITDNFEKSTSKKDRLEWKNKYEEVIDVLESRNDHIGYQRFYLHNKLYAKN